MDYLKVFIKKFTKNKEQLTEEVELSRMNAYLNAVHKILSWDDPALCWFVLGAIHVLFWAIVHFQFRLYGVIFSTILACLIADFYFEKSGLTAPRNASSDAIRNVFNVLQRSFMYLKSLRRDNPSMFCGLICSVFLSLSVISRNVPGSFLAYVTLLSIFFGPLVISKLPNKYKRNLSETVRSLTTNEGVLAENELIPFITDKDLNDKDPELESLLTDKTADSITSSLISGINAMPYYLDGEGSVDGLEEEDLIPTTKASLTLIDPNSSDSDSEHRNLRFESGHFRDSSSEEEMNYVAGLRFTDERDLSGSPSVMAKSIAQNIATGLLNNITSMGTNIVANVLSQPAATSTRRQDSDSDFEIINADEVDERY